MQANIISRADKLKLDINLGALSDISSVSEVMQHARKDYTTVWVSISPSALTKQKHFLNERHVQSDQFLLLGVQWAVGYSIKSSQFGPTRTYSQTGIFI